MASQGPLYPGASIITESTGSESNNDWTNPGNIAADDGSEAQITAATYDSPDISFRIKARWNSGQFTIPTDATIDGMVVEIDRRCFAGSAADFRVQFTDNISALIGNNKASASAWPGSSTVATYGSSSDVWGTSLAAADFNGGDFRVALSVSATSANTDIGVDFIRLTVHYTEAAGGVSVTPGTASLTTTRFAPTVLTPRLVTPGLATLTTTRFTPAVSVGIRLIPGVGTLTLTQFAPTVTASQHQLVTPGTASLTLSAFAPTVATPVVVIPGLATLTTSRFAPTVTVGAGVVLTPGTATLTIAPFAPTVLTPRTVTPGTASLSATPFAPAVLTPRLVTPQTASLTLTAFAPTVTGVSVRPPGMILSLPGTEGW